MERCLLSRGIIGPICRGRETCELENRTFGSGHDSVNTGGPEARRAKVEQALAALTQGGWKGCPNKTEVINRLQELKL